MRNLRYLVLAALATPAMADPNAIKQYEVIRQVYYQFDPHAYKSFTCHVDVSGLDATIANLKQSLAPRADSLQVRDDLASYSLTVDSEKGLSINNPTLDIAVLDDKKFADPAKVRLGIAQTKQGFDTQVQGIDNVISGVFNGYLGAMPELTSVTRDGNKWIVKYVEGGIPTTDTIDGPHLHEEANAIGLSVASDSDFTPVSGAKLGLQTSHIQINQGGRTVVTTMTVSYQKLGIMRVPASLVTKTTMVTPGLGQTMLDNTITFQSCALKSR